LGRSHKGAQICAPFQLFPTAGASCVQKGTIFGTLREAATDRTADIGIGEVMLSFALAQELKNAGFVPKTNANAVYFINDHLKIRREDALRMWYGDKARVGMDLDLSKEVVYSPTLTELIGACGSPFYLSCTDTGHWFAANTMDGEGGKTGETPAEAVARLWLLLESK
jgi:hypothetical protein